MNKRVTPEEFEKAVLGALTEYSDDVAERMHKAVDKVTKETAAEIKRRIPFTQRTRKYVRAFTTKTSYEDKLDKRNTWYVKSPQYRKTHLLEYGHRNRDGTYTRAFPHIKYGDELARKRLPELCEKAVKGEDIE
ncbi:MAG: HK97 gp10 family phage protein [Eubacteriales bacterium]